MTPLDAVGFAATALWRRRLRSSLCITGIAIGVCAVTSLTALGEGARRYVQGEFRFLGSDLLVVVPGRNETTGTIPGVGGVPNDLTLDDAHVLRRSLPGIRELAPVSVGDETVSAGVRRRAAIIFGTTHEMQRARDLQMQSGRFLPPGDWERGGPVAVLGSKLAAQLFLGERAVGRVVRIADWRMRVIGVLAPQGMHLGIDMDEIAFVPVATSLSMFDRTSLFRIVMRLQGPEYLDATRDKVEGILLDRHGELDVTCLTPDALAEAVGSITAVLTAALAGIAAVSLTVAGIGAMNVMLVSVSERTAEVGLLKAVGALDRQIVAVFLAEASLLCSAGGIAGLAATGILVALLRSAIPAFPAAVPLWAVGAALAVSLLVGVLFGVSPARRASRMTPVDALSRRPL